ncbi:MAG: SAM-dependent methyltransferase [Candidatus Accumulibacter sp.]|jgi:SAM-dependent MidA family methyltransferase|nr:SAM-dependent methyltransferase [Accumulibacter sp.]
MRENSQGDESARSENLKRRIAEEIEASGGWIDFARFMDLALYAPGLGYYFSDAEIFGESGDFVTAPELTPLFGRALAGAAREIMALCAPRIVEVGAGTGRLALDVLNELDASGDLPESYAILERSETLRARQKKTLGEASPRWLDRVEWIDVAPERFDGLVLANEVLDAMPVCRLRLGGGTPPAVFECGIRWERGEFEWSERLAAGVARERMVEAATEYALPEGFVAEIGLAAEDWVRSWGGILGKGVVLLVDYGTPRRERFHPRRGGGTLTCCRRHRVCDDALSCVGLQDITAHVDFSALADAAFDGGLDVLGYTSQAAFLLNCGIVDLLARIPASLHRAKETRAVQRLLAPEGMGELFKVIAFGKGVGDCGAALGSFSGYDRSAGL